MGVYTTLTDYLSELENDALGEWYVDPKIVDLVTDNKSRKNRFKCPMCHTSSWCAVSQKMYTSLKKITQNMSETVTVGNDNG